jgi:lauroyl/myristoyl acyltransferase
VAVAAIRRAVQPFYFQIVVADYFDAQAWASAVDPVVEITNRYTAALERIVLADPAQYLWAHLRWREASIPEEST